jgi:hypothetical protein
MYMDEEGTTLATEIFKELKASARRWFIAFLVMVGVEIATVAGFLWYISLPVDEVAIENDEGNALYVGDGNAVEGGVYNGTNNEETERNQK